MAFKLTERIRALLRADAHGVLDALEEKSLLLKQHLRDAELELLQKRARVGALADEESRLRDELGRQEALVAALDEDVRMALAGGKEELARFAVRRLLPERRELEQRRASLEDVGQTLDKLRRRLEEQEGAYPELVQRARARLAEARQGEATPDRLDLGADLPEEEVELELLRRRGAAAGGQA